MKVVQTELRTGDTTTIAYLPVDPRVKVGSVVSLDKDLRKWTVIRQYQTVEYDSIHRKWEVGGL